MKFNMFGLCGLKNMIFGNFNVVVVVVVIKHSSSYWFYVFDLSQDQTHVSLTRPPPWCLPIMRSILLPPKTMLQ